jgi:hypothetical protein
VGTGVVMAHDQDSRRRTKNIAIAVILAALAALFYLITIVKMGGSA